MKRFLPTAAALLLAFAAGARTVEHIIDRGETLESIAKSYGVTEEAIRKANPALKDMFFSGMIIQISLPDEGAPMTDVQPGTDTDTYTTSPALPEETAYTQPQTYTYPQTPAQSYTSAGDDELRFEDFSNISLTWNSSFKDFEHGFYGLWWTTGAEWAKNFGFNVGVETTAGVMKNGYSVAMHLGFNYGYPVNQHVMPCIRLNGFYSLYAKDTIIGQRTTWSYKGSHESDIKHSATYGGAYLTPSVAFRFGDFVLSAGYDLGFIVQDLATNEKIEESGQYHYEWYLKTKNKTSFHHRLCLSVGIHFGK